MPQIIEVPGFGQVEFPDGMSDAQIVAAIRANTAGPSKGPQTRPVNPNRDKSGGQLALAGARKFMGDVALGAAQLASGVQERLGHPQAAEYSALLRSQADIRKMDPTLRTWAGQAGYTGAAIVPAVAAALIPGANTVVGSALIGGAMGATQPVGAGDSRGWNAGLGALAGGAGQGLFNLIGRIAQPVAPVLNAAEDKAVALLQSKGVTLSTGQRTGSKAVQSIERTLGDNPASAAAMARQGERFRDSYTRAVLRTAGVNADQATPEILGAAQRRIGGVMDDIAQRYSLDVMDTHTANALNALERRAGMELLNDPRIGMQIQTIRQAVTATGGKLDGTAYKHVKTTLDNLSRQQNIGPYAAELREILDDSLHRATKGTADFARLKLARTEYRNLMAIADVADTTANGRVTPAALAARLKSNKYTRNSMRFGKGDVELAKLARAGSTVVDRFPQSGTAPRAAAQVAIPAAIGAGGYALSGDPETAAKIALATWALPKAGGMAATSPFVQNYLSQGITQPALRNLLMAPSRAGLGSLVPAYLLSQE